MLEQLCYLDTNLYDKAGIKSVELVENRSIGTLLSVFDSTAIAKLESLGDTEIDGACASGKEWAQIIRYLQTSELKDLVLTGTLDNDEGIPLALCFTDGSSSTKEAIVAFKGTTGGDEWKDNVEGANQQDTDKQIEALDYINSLTYSEVTVIGHSKGGNKAQYVAVLSEKVTRCVSFDGQGFSSYFLENYEYEIKQKASIITGYSLSTDYVHILLYEIPGATYITCKGYGVDNVKQHHSPNSFFQTDDNGMLILDSGLPVFIMESEDESVTLLRNYISYILETGSDDQVDAVILYISNLFPLLFSGNESNEVIEYILSDKDSLAIIMGSLLSYVDENNLNSSDIENLLTTLGVDSLGWLYNWFIDIGISNLTDGEEDPFLLEVIWFAKGGEIEDLGLSKDEFTDLWNKIEWQYLEFYNPDNEIEEKSIGEQLVNGWVAFWNQVGSDLYNSYEKWTQYWNALSGAFYKKLQNIVSDLHESWSIFWSGIGESLYETIQSWSNFLSDIGSALYEEILGWKNYFENFSNLMSDFWNNWCDFWEDVGSDLYDVLNQNSYSIKIGTSLDDVIHGGNNINLIIGGSGNDVLHGNSREDILYGGAGDDILYGDDGEDLLYGGNGNDKLIGGAGNDELYGGEGDDILYGDNEVSLLRTLNIDDTITSDDILHGGNGNDTLYGGQGSDKLFGDAGNDELHGDDGNDELFGGDGDDTLYGDAGNDYLEDLTGDNHLYGGDGDDTLVSGDGTDYMYGGSGNDYFIGGNGENHMYGEDGDDRLQGGEGFDYMEGGLGNDNMSGGNGNNEMYGQEGNDQIYGGNDNDYIDGGVGDDELYGGNGNNTIYGGEGNDIIYDGDDGSHIYGGSGNDTIRAGGGNDVIDAGEGDDYIQDDHGDDTIIFKAGYGTDTISDAAGNNTIELSGLSIEDAVMSRINWSDLKISFGDDNIIIKQYFDGGAFQNFNINGIMINDLITTLHGSDGDDWMSAWNDNGVSMSGGNGNDTIQGGNGNDILDGGANNDMLRGGNGEDIYIFGKGYGSDTVEDWNGNSTINLKDINSDEVTVSSIYDSNLVLSINGTEDKLTVNGFKWNQNTFTFEFADGVTGTVNKDTWTLELDTPKPPETTPESEETIVQNNADLLAEIYGNDTASSELFGETDDIMIAEDTATSSIIPNEEADVISEQTDIQTIVLIDAMAGFASESNIADTNNLADTADSTIMNQLIVGTQAQ